MAAARAKSLQVRQAKSSLKKVNVGLGQAGQVNTDLDVQYINSWLSERKYIISHVASLMRNGLIEKGFKDEQVNESASVLGEPVAAAGCNKFKGLRVNPAIVVLGIIFGNAVSQMFKGANRLSGYLAVKALMKVLGVDEDTPLPQGYNNGLRLKPFSWLCASRIAQLGNKLTEEQSQLEATTDWFTLTEDKKVLCNTGRGAVEMNVAVDLSTADDWAIRDPQSFLGATLISDEVGVDLGLARAYLKVHEAPTHNTPFHYPKDLTNVPGFSKSSSSSQTLALADGVVEAAPVLAIVAPS